MGAILPARARFSKSVGMRSKNRIATLYFMKSNRGFTLLELLIVIGIITVLATLAIWFIGNAREKGRVAALVEFQHNLELAQEAYPNSKTSGWWDFNASANDSSGGNNAISGIDAYTKEGPGGMQAAHIGYSAAVSPAKNLPTGSFCYTTFRRYDGTTAGHLMRINGSSVILALYNDTGYNGQVEFSVAGVGSLGVPSGSALGFTSGKWHLITASYNAATGNVKFYMDDKKLYDNTSASRILKTPYAATNLVLKSYPWGTQETYIGHTRLWPIPCQI
jgi:prepilin-type N-terminal cleavage/methylation domain-containing protein